MAKEKKVWMLAGDVFIQLSKDQAIQTMVEENNKIDEILILQQQQQQQHQRT
jgi:hypothetical protein